MPDCKKCEWHCCGNCGNTEPNAMKSSHGTIICKVLPVPPSIGTKGKTPIVPRSPCKHWVPRTESSSKKVDA